MKIKIIEIGEHCFGPVLRVNDKEYEELTDQEIQEIILDSLKNPYTKRELLQIAIESIEGETIDSYNSKCEGCGNWNNYQKILINNTEE